MPLQPLVSLRTWPRAHSMAPRTVRTWSSPMSTSLASRASGTGTSWAPSLSVWGPSVVMSTRGPTDSARASSSASSSAFVLAMTVSCPLSGEGYGAAIGGGRVEQPGQGLHAGLLASQGTLDCGAALLEHVVVLQSLAGTLAGFLHHGAVPHVPAGPLGIACGQQSGQSCDDNGQQLVGRVGVATEQDDQDARAQQHGGQGQRGQGCVRGHVRVLHSLSSV